MSRYTFDRPVLTGLLVLASVGTMAPQGVVPPCGPGNTIPAGESTCRRSDGGVVVGPPPAARATPVVVPPPVYVPPPTATRPGPQAPQLTAQSAGDSGSPLWTNVAWLGAIAGLIGAVALLVRAFRE